jgi:hypothetical protein
MIRLDPGPGLKDVDLGYGVTLTCAPLTSALWAAAKSDPAIGMISEDRPAAVVTVEMVKAIARRVIVGWDGVGDADGNPVAPSPAWIGLLFDMNQFFEAFTARYVADYLLLSAEGNGSASLRIGNSGGANATVPAAARPARSARSGSTPRKQ